MQSPWYRCKQDLAGAAVDIHETFAGSCRTDQGLTGALNGKVQCTAPRDGKVIVDLQDIVVQFDLDQFFLGTLTDFDVLNPDHQPDKGIRLNPHEEPIFRHFESCRNPLRSYLYLQRLATMKATMVLVQRIPDVHTPRNPIIY